MKKNTSGQVVGAQLNSRTDGSPITTGTVTVYVTGGGSPTQAVGSVGSGAATHEGQGFWTYAPAQDETNYDHVAFTFTIATAVHATIQLYPSFPQTGDNYARLGAPAGASVSADVAAVKADTAATLIDTAEIGAAGAGLTGITGVTLAASQPGVTIPTVTTLTGHTPQTGDNFVRLGAPTGASVSADVAAVKSDTAAILIDTAEIGAAGAGLTVLASAANLATVAGYIDTEIADIQSRLPAALVGGRIDASVGAMAANTLTASALATDAVTEIQSGLATASALSTVDSNVVLIVADTSELQTDWTNGGRLDNILDARAATGDAMTLTSGERTTLAGVIWSTVILGTSTAIQLMRGFAAALLAKASGMNTSTAVFRDVDDTKDVITATVDQYGNRSSVTLDLN